MSDKQFTNWIDSYVSYMSDSHYPSFYNRIVAINILSATVNRNCWIDFKYYKLYPNVYTILIEHADLELLSCIIHGIDLLQSSKISILLYNHDLITSNIISYMYDNRVASVYTNMMFYKTPCLLHNFNIESLYVYKSHQFREFFEFINLLYSNLDHYSHYDYSAKVETLLDAPFLSILLGCSYEFSQKHFTRLFYHLKYLKGNILWVHNYKRKDDEINSTKDNQTKPTRSELIGTLQVISKLYGRMNIDNDVLNYLDEKSELTKISRNILKRLVIIHALSNLRGVIIKEDVDKSYKLMMEVERRWYSIK